MPCIRYCNSEPPKNTGIRCIVQWFEIDLECHSANPAECEPENGGTDRPNKDEYIKKIQELKGSHGASMRYGEYSAEFCISSYRTYFQKKLLPDRPEALGTKRVPQLWRCANLQNELLVNIGSLILHDKASHVKHYADILGRCAL
jgi:hypothetical protein